MVWAKLTSLWSFMIRMCRRSDICEEWFLGSPYQYLPEVPLSEGCRPRLVGPWIPSVEYPLNLDEAQGGKIGNDLIVVGGYLLDYRKATPQVWALDTTDTSAEWRQMDDMPISDGLTHGAFVMVEEMYYMCGGFVVGCFVLLVVVTMCAMSLT